MKWLVRLYPRAWRDRYGPELEALLGDTPRSFGVIADVAHGALRAHGRAWHTRLRSPLGTRLVLFSGAFWALLFLSGAAIGAGSYVDDLGLPILAGLASTLALGQLVSRQADDRLATFGAVVSAAGAAIVAGSVVLRMVGGLRLGLDPALEPRGTWDQGMVLFLAGCAITGMAIVARSSSMAQRAVGVVITGASVVLTVALIDPLGGAVMWQMESESGQAGGSMGFAGVSVQHAAELMVTAAGLLGVVLLIARSPSPRMRLLAMIALGSLLAIAAASVLPWWSGRWIGVDAWAAKESSGFLQLLSHAGWFPSSAPTVIAGILFGVAWAALGWLRLRAQVTGVGTAPDHGLELAR